MEPSILGSRKSFCGDNKAVNLDYSKIFMHFQIPTLKNRLCAECDYPCGNVKVMFLESMLSSSHCFLNAASKMLNFQPIIEFGNPVDHAGDSWE